LRGASAAGLAGDADRCARCVRPARKSLATDLGRDADDSLRVFEALPDVAARTAFVRTLRRGGRSPRSGDHLALDRCCLTRGMPTLLN